MLPKIHIIIGAIFSILLWLAFPQVGWLGALMVFSSSVLMDFDHYLYYIIIKRDFSLKNAYNWFIKNSEKHKRLPENIRKNVYTAICWFHGIELLILIGILIFFSKVFLFVLIGFAFHLLTDLIDAYSKSQMGHSPSFTYKFIKTRKFNHIDEFN